MLGLTDVELEVVLVAEVHTVNPRRIVAVSLSILALMLLEITVVVQESHEAIQDVLGLETEVSCAHTYLVVARDVDGIIVEAVAVHVVLCHEAVVGVAAPSLIDEAVVVAALVVEVH